jgi:hypothetical protein
VSGRAQYHLSSPSAVFQLNFEPTSHTIINPLIFVLHTNCVAQSRRSLCQKCCKFITVIWVWAGITRPPAISVDRLSLDSLMSLATQFTGTSAWQDLAKRRCTVTCVILTRGLKTTHCALCRQMYTEQVGNAADATHEACACCADQS